MRIHNHANSDEADQRTGDVESIGAETVHRYRPQQGSGDKDAAVRGEDATEVGIGLHRRDQSVEAERDHAEADPDPALVLANSLPHQPGSTDFEYGGKNEQQKRAGDGHGAQTSVYKRAPVSAEKKYTSS